MADGFGKGALAGALAAGLALGAAGGWVAGRTAAEAGRLPPPPAFVNPLADAVRGESLVLKQAGTGTLKSYLVREAGPEDLLLAEEHAPKDLPRGVKEFRVARNFFGALVILEGDLDPETARATVRDFVLERAEADLLRVEDLGRTFRCWRFRGRHRVAGEMTVWVTDELPVHGVARIDGPRGKLWEVSGFGTPSR
jgi:hypothetical protein